MGKGKKILFIGVTFLLLILSAIFVWKYYNTPLSIKEISPKDNSIDIAIDQEIRVAFNGTPAPDQKKYLTLTSNNLAPQGAWVSEGKTFKYVFNENYSLAPLTEYRIEIQPLSNNGTSGEIIVSKFKTTSFANLTSEMSRDIAAKTDTLEDGKEKGHEIISELPIENKYFKMTYEPLKDGVGVNYYVKLYGDRTVSKNNFQSWLTKLGISESSLNIIYE